MNINRDNYEAYFLDYLEGNLSGDQEEILQRFLQFNPDLKQELDSFTETNLLVPEMTFPGKQSLYKSIPGKGDHVDEDNFELFCIARLEKDLDEEQLREFDRFLMENPELEPVFLAYRKTYLEGEKLIYDGKRSLRKRKSLVPVIRILAPLTAAAALALMLFLGPREVVENTEFSETVVPENTEVEEASIEPETVEEDKKPPVRSLPATLKVIKNTKAPVPVSTHKKDEMSKRQEDATDENSNKRIASINLSNTAVYKMDVRYDQLVEKSLPSPSIHPGSLSAIDLARYQYQRASKAMEEEDVLLYSLASKGIKELNRLAGTRAELMASRDGDGSISGIRFKSRFLNITTPIEKEEE